MVSFPGFGGGAVSPPALLIPTVPHKVWGANLQPLQLEYFRSTTRAITSSRFWVKNPTVAQHPNPNPTAPAPTARRIFCRPTCTPSFLSFGAHGPTAGAGRWGKQKPRPTGGPGFGWGGSAQAQAPEGAGRVGDGLVVQDFLGAVADAGPGASGLLGAHQALQLQRLRGELGHVVGRVLDVVGVGGPGGLVQGCLGEGGEPLEDVLLQVPFPLGGFVLNEVVHVVHLGGHLVEVRSEEHTSELQSRGHLVCRLLLEKKKV